MEPKKVIKDGVQYNIHPSAIGASELSVTLPEIVVNPQPKYPDTSDYYLWNPSNFTIPGLMKYKIRSLQKMENGDIHNVAQRIYNTVSPRPTFTQSYDLFGMLEAEKSYKKNRLRNFLREGISTSFDGMYANRNRTREAQFAKYLGLPTFKYNYYDEGIFEDSVDSYLQPAEYMPKKGKPLGDIVRLPRHESLEDELNDRYLAALYRSAQNGDSIRVLDGSSTLGDFIGSIGKDSLGNYISYYDEWDLNPLNNGKGNQKDLFYDFGIGHPFSLYDRRYFTDYELKKALQKYSEKETDVVFKIPRKKYDQ